MKKYLLFRKLFDRLKPRYSRFGVYYEDAGYSEWKECVWLGRIFGRGNHVLEQSRHTLLPWWKS